MQNLDMENLEHQIRDIICKCYNRRYTGRLEIKFLNPGFDVALFLNTDYQPIHIAAQLPLEEYLQFFEKEIRLRHLSHNKYYTGYQTYKDDDYNKHPEDCKSSSVI